MSASAYRYKLLLHERSEMLATSLCGRKEINASIVRTERNTNFCMSRTKSKLLLEEHNK